MSITKGSTVSIYEYPNGAEIRWGRRSIPVSEIADFEAIAYSMLRALCAWDCEEEFNRAVEAARTDTQKKKEVLKEQAQDFAEEFGVISDATDRIMKSLGNHGK